MLLSDDFVGVKRFKGEAYNYYKRWILKGKTAMMILNT
jgi:hypothetical protein